MQWAEESKWGQAQEQSEPWRDRLQFESAASEDERLPEAEH